MNPYRQKIQSIKFKPRSFCFKLRRIKRKVLLWLGNKLWREEKCPWCPKRGCTWAQQYFCQYYDKEKIKRIKK